MYGGFALVEVSANQLTTLAEDVLAPLSYLALTAVGLVIVWRGIRSLRKAQHKCTCHAHGATPQAAAQVRSFRDAVALIGSTAVRPCTGAIFLLVIAWQMDIKIAGALAVLTMGRGTASLTSLVALSSIAARRVTRWTATPLGGLDVVVPAMQVFAGVSIALFSIVLLKLAL